jgi:hypothetical protein
MQDLFASEPGALGERSGFLPAAAVYSSESQQGLRLRLDSETQAPTLALRLDSDTQAPDLALRLDSQSQAPLLQLRLDSGMQPDVDQDAAAAPEEPATVAGSQGEAGLAKSAEEEQNEEEDDEETRGSGSEEEAGPDSGDEADGEAGAAPVHDCSPHRKLLRVVQARRMRHACCMC